MFSTGGSIRGRNVQVCSTTLCFCDRPDIAMFTIRCCRSQAVPLFLSNRLLHVGKTGTGSKNNELPLSRQGVGESACFPLLIVFVILNSVCIFCVVMAAVGEQGGGCTAGGRIRHSVLRNQRKERHQRREGLHHHRKGGQRQAHGGRSQPGISRVGKREPQLTSIQEEGRLLLRLCWSGFVTKADGVQQELRDTQWRAVSSRGEPILRGTSDSTSSLVRFHLCWEGRKEGARGERVRGRVREWGRKMLRPSSRPQRRVSSS